MGLDVGVAIGRSLLKDGLEALVVESPAYLVQLGCTLSVTSPQLPQLTSHMGQQARRVVLGLVILVLC